MLKLMQAQILEIKFIVMHTDKFLPCTSTHASLNKNDQRINLGKIACTEHKAGVVEGGSDIETHEMKHDIVHDIRSEKLKHKTCF